MTVYVALLRGINAGPSHRIKMMALQQSFEALGLRHVQTYIQSGNVLFESESHLAALTRQLESHLEAAFGFAIPVMLRTAAEWRELAQCRPFLEEDCAAANLYISLFAREPSLEDIARLHNCVSEFEDFHLRGADMYLYLRDGVRNSKLAKALQKLSTPSTMRNWNTVVNLAQLAESIERDKA